MNLFLAAPQSRDAAGIFVSAMFSLALSGCGSSESTDVESGLGPEASAWVTIGDPGNPPDSVAMNDGTTGYGSVAYVYEIARYEVTNAQYASFLNAVAKTDPYQLYHPFMDRSQGLNLGCGIVRTGVAGSFSYAPETGRDNRPINYVSVFDAMRYANWLHNGGGSGDTETGAYTLVGGTVIPANGYTVQRSPGARYVLPTEDEWYKAAYYDSKTSRYFAYPAGADEPSTCSPVSSDPNHANCENANVPSGGGNSDSSDVGSYIGSPSPYGTYDQAGNIHEWDETIKTSAQNNAGDGVDRVLRGGDWVDAQNLADSANRSGFSPESEFAAMGFRLARLGDGS